MSPCDESRSPYLSIRIRQPGCPARLRLLTRPRTNRCHSTRRSPGPSRPCETRHRFPSRRFPSQTDVERIAASEARESTRITAVATLFNNVCPESAKRISENLPFPAFPGVFTIDRTPKVRINMSRGLARLSTHPVHRVPRHRFLMTVHQPSIVRRVQ